MITLRPSHERSHNSPREQLWQTFDRADRPDAVADGFEALHMLNEDFLAPRAHVARHPQHAFEIITYVRVGTVAYEDATGRLGMIGAGEFHRGSSRNAGHIERNASHNEHAHVFHLWLRPPSGSDPGTSDAQRRFSAADRRGRLCLVASQDARSGSLRLHQDASIYSALLEHGQHVVHALEPGHRAWLHVVQGAASLGALPMTTGDGAGVVAERAVSFTARDATEILLLDFGEPTEA